MTSPFTIMCFSWNAGGLKLCETMSQSKADDSRTGFKAFISMKRPCLAPDFFEEIRNTIDLRRPSLVVMTTQDEDSKDTYFHSDLLPTLMPEIGYSLLKRDKLNKVGEVASGLIPQRVKTGIPSGSALRISIYANYTVIQGLRVEEKILTKFFSNNGQVETTCDQGDRISGAIASYVWHEDYGKFAFIATHLPSGASTLKIGNDLDYASYRAASKSSNTLCLLKIYNQFVSSLPIESRPDHIFLLGDLNYDIVIPGKNHAEILSALSANITVAKLKDLQQYDELKKSLDEVPLVGFKEGVSSEGPLFVPTWRLARGRPDSCNLGKEITRMDVSCFGGSNDPLGGIGWHDRILYKELMTSNYMAHCTDYNRIDVRNMHASTHAGVTAFFEMRSIQ
jgi:hypothetical protein